jgi:hypothetical protein
MERSGRNLEDQRKPHIHSQPNHAKRCQNTGRARDAQDGKRAATNETTSSAADNAGPEFRTATHDATEQTPHARPNKDRMLETTCVPKSHYKWSIID